MPAPIVSRTTPSPQQAIQVPSESATASADIASVVTPGIDPNVTSAPIRSPGSGIEVRPLEAQPMMPGDTAHKNFPRLVKRPFSDQSLAEMQAADAPGGFQSVPVPSASPPAAVAEPSSAAPSSAPSVATAPAAGGSDAFAWPARGRIVQPFADPRSLGIVIDGAIGDPVSAAADGRVIFSGTGPRGYGNLLIVKHDDNTVSVYGHNRSLLVKEGQSVKRGQKVAEVGDTSAERPGLLFEIRKQGKPVDPIPFLPKR